MNWLLIAALAVLILFALNGGRKGFIRTVFSIFSLVIALLLTVTLSPYVSKMLQRNENITGFVREGVEKAVPIQKKVKSISDEADVIQKLTLPESLKEALLQNNSEDMYSVLGAEQFADYIHGYLTCVVMNALSFLITLILVRIILFVLVRVLDIMSHIPILNGLNKTAGFLVGVLEGFLFLWILCIVLTMAGSTPEGKYLFGLIQDSTILSNIYNNNLLLKGITDMAKVLF